MQMVDFNQYVQNQRMYGGTAGRKMGIVYGGKNYIMFVVDALIGNTDRNNSNWGVIVRGNGKKELAPVYDNGNCLNSKWDDEKMQMVLSDEKRLEAESFSARRCIFELESKKLNPYHLIERMKYEGCNEAVRNITPKISVVLPKIEKMILGIPVLTEVQKKFYLAVIEERYEKVFKPVCQKIMEQQMEE